MPLTRHIRVIAGSLQQCGYGDNVTAQHPLVVGILLLLMGRQHLGNIGHTGNMRVHAGEQHRPSWRTVGRGVIVGKTDALLRQRIDSGRANFAAVGREIGEAQIIGQHQHDIGSLNRRCIELCCGANPFLCQHPTRRKHCQCHNGRAKDITNRHALNSLC